MRLPEFLCTSPARLGELTERLGAAATWSRFVRNRPHGVLIARVAALGDGVLEPAFGEPIPVRGRIAVFGERAGAARTEWTARAPYLAACVVGQAAIELPVEVLSAYVHPIAAGAHLMLVDSDLERQTLAQLRSVQRWLGRQGSPVAIEKPLFDVAPCVAPGSDSAAEPQPPRPPCIPDFVVRGRRAGDGRETVAIVETMGFADEEYRARKERLHPMMRAALGDAPVVVHDFHAPAGRSQAWRDDQFWRELRARLSPDPIRAGRRGRPAPRVET